MSNSKKLPGREDIEYLKAANRLSKIGSWIMPANRAGHIQRIIEEILKAPNYEVKIDSENNLVKTGIPYAIKLKAMELALKINDQALKANIAITMNEIKMKVISLKKEQLLGNDSGELDISRLEGKEFDQFGMIIDMISNNLPMSEKDFTLFGKLMTKITSPKSSNEKSQKRLD